MRTTGVVVVVAIAGTACFNTARYDTAHVQRVVDINARYADELRRQDASHAAGLAALEQLRASLVPIEPGSSSRPLVRVDQRADIVECRSQRPRPPIRRDVCQLLYLDALLRTYVHADVASVTRELASSPDADLESLLTRSHNQAVLHRIDDQAASLARSRDQAHQRLELARETEVRASTR